MQAEQVKWTEVTFRGENIRAVSFKTRNVNFFLTNQKMEIVDTNTSRFHDLFEPLVGSVFHTFQLERSIDEILGVALISTRGTCLFEWGQLDGCFTRPGSIGQTLVEAVEAPPRSASLAPEGSDSFDVPARGPSESLVVGGRRFVVWQHESKVRLYAASTANASNHGVSASSWGLAIRRLRVGYVVSVHARPLQAQRFLPEFEKFCDEAGRR